MNDKVVAKVNGKEINQGDVLKFLNDVGPQVAMQFQSPEGIQKVVDELVNQELLYLEALENKVDKEDEFNQILEETKVVLLKNYAISKLLSKETVSQDEIKNYYDENKDHFAKPQSVVASHILVEDEDMANKIGKEIKDGKSFEDAAKEYSTCPSKEKGGDLGEFTRGQMVPEFEDKAFEMEEGTISEPVKTQFGYHIIKLVKKNEAGQKTFDEVKAEIEQIVLGLKQQTKYLDKVNELKNKYEVEIVNN